MFNKYLVILEESLQNKLQVLNEISVYNHEQENLLKQGSFTMENLDSNMDQKESLIQKIEKLDEGFETLYEKAKEELIGNKEAYSDQIKRLQFLIKQITEKSVTIQAEETRNKKLIENYFDCEKRRLKQGRQSSKAAFGYYQSMSNQATAIAASLLDQKK